MTVLRRCRLVVCMTVLTASLSGCAMFISDPEERAEVIEANDPIEGVNRHIFAVNLALDTFILRPVSVVYREFMPDPGKDMVRNFVHNLKLPFTAINDLLQGEPDRAETAMSRFLVNSTMGVGGLFDAATGLGLDYHEEDFGQTLAVHGSEEGPYLMLPIFGPSNLRDAIGLVVQFFADPVGIAANEAGADDFGLITGGMEAVDSRHRHAESFDTLQRQSLDFYAAVRSLYRQRRAAEINNYQSDAVPTTPIASAAGERTETIAFSGVEPISAHDPTSVTGSLAGTTSDVAPAEAAPGIAAGPIMAEAPTVRAPQRAMPHQLAPTAATPEAQIAALPEDTRRNVPSTRVDATAIGHKSMPEEAEARGPRQMVSQRFMEPAPFSREPDRMESFADAMRAFDDAARSFDEMTGSSFR